MEAWYDERWRTASKENAPEYTSKSPAPGQNCGNCRFLVESQCKLYSFNPSKEAWCQSWKDGSFYGWWGGGRFPHHGTPPEGLRKPEDMDTEGGATGDAIEPLDTIPEGNNSPNQGSGQPGNRSR